MFYTPQQPRDRDATPHGKSGTGTGTGFSFPPGGGGGGSGSGGSVYVTPRSTPRHIDGSGGLSADGGEGVGSSSSSRRGAYVQQVSYLEVPVPSHPTVAGRARRGGPVAGVDPSIVFSVSSYSSGRRLCLLVLVLAVVFFSRGRATRRATIDASMFRFRRYGMPQLWTQTHRWLSGGGSHKPLYFEPTFLCSKVFFFVFVVLLGRSHPLRVEVRYRSASTMPRLLNKPQRGAYRWCQGVPFARGNSLLAPAAAPPCSRSSSCSCVPVSLDFVLCPHTSAARHATLLTARYPSPAGRSFSESWTASRSAQAEDGATRRHHHEGACHQPRRRRQQRRPLRQRRRRERGPHTGLPGLRGLSTQGGECHGCWFFGGSRVCLSRFSVFHFVYRLFSFFGRCLCSIDRRVPMWLLFHSVLSGWGRGSESKAKQVGPTLVTVLKTRANSA